MNYARNTTTKETVFFSDEMPDRLKKAALENWAFWEVPGGQNPATFPGKLIAEDPSHRCVRMRHVPKHKQCSVCNPLNDMRVKD